MTSPAPAPAPTVARMFDLALLSDPGTTRQENQDACGRFDESPGCVLFVVADGVGGHAGGQEASRIALKVTIEAFKSSPATWGTEKRLFRAVQQANIEIHDRAMIVPELRQMRTTITAAVFDHGTLHASHVGDCRLYLHRGGTLLQLTKDHTVAAGRARMGLIRADRVADHPEHSTLTRCLGHDLIVAVDRLSRPLEEGDQILVCSDGLYNTLDEPEMASLMETKTADGACQALITTANTRGSGDNLTAAVFRLEGPPPPAAERPGLRDRLARLIGI